MTDFSTLLQQGASNAWLFIPTAILLGALHGLEPGHSKTMMAAFIVAIRGTVRQAVLLGLSATVSHTAVVWLIALGGLYFGQSWYGESSEAYLQLASAVLMIGIAVWMLWRTWRNQHACFHDHSSPHDHDHGHSDHSAHAAHGDDEHDDHDDHDDHDHDHDEYALPPAQSKRIDTGHGILRLDIVGAPATARFRLSREGSATRFGGADVFSVEIEREGGARQSFSFTPQAGFLESTQTVAEPHAFVVRLHWVHGHHSHDYDVEFVGLDDGHAPHHVVADYESLDVSAPGYQDPHELAHANDIRRRFAHRVVTTRQIVLFGLGGGLIPCPASITVLLLCLQLKKIALGATLVLCFSIGLALTMVLSGALAALSIRHIAKRWNGFGRIAAGAPYLSGGLILSLGMVVAYQAWRSLT